MRRFLNVQSILKGLSQRPSQAPRSIPVTTIHDDLFRFASSLTSMEKFLQEEIPKRVAALSLDTSQVGWNFLAYGFVRMDKSFVEQLENMYRPEFYELQASGYLPSLPEDFAAKILWEGVMAYCEG